MRKVYLNRKCSVDLCEVTSIDWNDVHRRYKYDICTDFDSLLISSVFSHFFVMLIQPFLYMIWGKNQIGSECSILFAELYRRRVPWGKLLCISGKIHVDTRPVRKKINFKCELIAPTHGFIVLVENGKYLLVLVQIYCLV